MESVVYSSKIQEYQNQNVKQCPSCNMILPLSEYDDHIFCHELDQGENGIGSYNINNFNIDVNNTNNINNNNTNNNNNNNKNNNSDNNNENNCPQPPLQTSNNIQNNNANNNNNITHINNNNNNNNSDNINISPIEEIINNNHINEDNVDSHQNNNHINCINDNSPPPTISNNPQPKKEDQKSNEPESNSANLLSKISNFFSSTISNSKNEDKKSDSTKKEPENIDYNSLSEEERKKIFEEQEKKAYEKKILGLIDEPDNNRTLQQKIEDNVENLLGNPTDILFGAIDLVGCFFRVGPSIARTVVRAGNLINRGIQTFNNDNSFNGSIKKKNKDAQAIINCLPFTIVREKKEHDNNNNCVICMCDFEINDKISTLPCAHVFHTECIISWIKKETTCPICKFEITLSSLVGNNGEEV